MIAKVCNDCTGCGLCENICPEVFELGDNGMAKVKLNIVPRENMYACAEAEET